MLNGTVRHKRVLPKITESRNELAVILAPHSLAASGKSGGHVADFDTTAGSLSTDARRQRDPGVNDARGCRVAAGCSDNNRAPVIDMARAAEGAREAARVIRHVRKRDMLASIEEFRRASGPDRAWWRRDALHRLAEWRRLYRIPERTAFQQAVARGHA